MILIVHGQPSPWEPRMVLGRYLCKFPCRFIPVLALGLVPLARGQEVAQVLAKLPSPIECVEGAPETELDRSADLESGLDKPIPWERIAPKHREAMVTVVENPAFSCLGPVETFVGKPNYYAWLLDHPDSTTVLWQRLGAKCLPIQSLGNDSFRWSDPDHGQISWTMVHRDNDMRVWHANGRMRAGKLMPFANVDAVLVARYQTGKTSQDRPAIRHQYQLFLRTDSRATAMAARLLGASVPKLAQQYMGQLQLFFHGMAWMDEEQPRRSARLVDGIVPPEVLRPVVAADGAPKVATRVAKPVSAPAGEEP